MENPDQRAADYNAGFEAGKEHSTPSPETKARMETMRHEVVDLRKEITSNFGYLKEKLDFILTQTTATNGKVANLQEWRLRTEGAGGAIKAVWTFVAVYVVAATFGLFTMYIQFQSIDYKITTAITNALTDYDQQHR